MNFRKDFRSESPGFQMAPMIDIVFLLLIFFMVATIYAQWETKIGITVPTTDTGTQSPRGAGEIIINLDEQGRVFINSIEMDRERLRDLLSQIGKTFKGQPVIIRADRSTDYEAVIGILDLCRQVDIWNISFATLPNTPATP